MIESSNTDKRQGGPVTRAARTFGRGLLAGLCLFVIAAGALAATGHSHVPFSRSAELAKSSSGPVATAARVGTPRLAAPADDAVADALPSFSWSRVKGAAKYEFQLSADPDFGAIVGGQSRGSYQTLNTYGTVDKTVPNGTYYWRARAIDGHDDAGRWSRTHSLRKTWNTQPTLFGPRGETIEYPQVPLVLRWSSVPYAFKYLVEIGTDRSLASPVIKPVETSGTVLALPATLPQGDYFWAVTPLDAGEHIGTRSAVGTFTWRWPTTISNLQVTDLNPDPRVVDPRFSWDPLPGAARYEVEVNASVDWALGSKVCCTETTLGTSLAPKKVLPNNDYYWRVRAIDLDGNAGEWNVHRLPNGEPKPFTKTFDDVDPSIPGLHLRSNIGPIATGSITNSPVVAWDPVPGASSYEVDVVPYVLGGCNWTSDTPDTWKEIKTAATAWTPLGSNWNGQVPGGVSFPNASHDRTRTFEDGGEYCVRVLARSDRDAKNGDIVSDWTQLGGIGNPAFEYDAPPAPTPFVGTLATPAGNYQSPTSGSVHARLPLFTWNPVDHAASYFVVVARDPDFTDVIDVGFTRVPAYAPRTTFGPKTYADESTNYYWVVMPAKGHDGDQVTTLPQQNNTRSFHKESSPPALIAPPPGSEVTTQPSLHWSSVEGAREYRLQVAEDSTFANLIDDVTTNATAYTSSSTYPADTKLYWRVRANDENKVGLRWSPTGSFRRRLPAPVPSPSNPTAGSTVPVLSWSPVQGATSYDFHIEQPDGKDREFRMGSTAATFIVFAGTGVWRWQVRANFPKQVLGEAHGPYSPFQSFTRRIEAPAAARHVNGARRVVLAWDPSPMAREYRVQLSHSDSFAKLVETHITENTSYAPKLIQQGYQEGGKLYWRVAAADEGHNLGAWTTRVLTTLKRMKVSAAGRLVKRKRGVVTIKVTDSRRRALRKARIKVSGAGVRARTKSTSKRGTVKFKLRAKRSGRVVFRALKNGYRPSSATVRIR